MNFQDIKISVTNHVGWLEYDKPPINAFDWDTMGEIVEGIASLVANPEARVIVIASALEKYFSVGADLNTFDGISREKMAVTVDMNHRIANSLRESPKPLLAAIHGTAVGGGLEITLHCDLRFAAEDTRFSQPEIKIAFIPPIATTQTLVRLLGRPRAIRYLYEGGFVSAPEALEMGLVDFLHPPETLRAEVQAYAEALAQKPPEALEAIRKTITEGMELPMREAMQLEKDWVLRLTETRNFQEGISAFLNKKEPNWKWEE